MPKLLRSTYTLSGKLADTLILFCIAGLMQIPMMVRLVGADTQGWWESIAPPPFHLPQELWLQFVGLGFLGKYIVFSIIECVIFLTPYGLWLLIEKRSPSKRPRSAG